MKCTPKFRRAERGPSRRRPRRRDRRPFASLRGADTFRKLPIALRPGLIMASFRYVSAAPGQLRLLPLWWHRVRGRRRLHRLRCRDTIRRGYLTLSLFRLLHSVRRLCGRHRCVTVPPIADADVLRQVSKKSGTLHHLVQQHLIGLLPTIGDKIQGTKGRNLHGSSQPQFLPLLLQGGDECLQHLIPGADSIDSLTDINPNRMCTNQLPMRTG